MSASHLKAIPLFSTLSERDCERLGQAMQAQDFDANHTIFWMGEEGTDFFIIQSGTVELLLQDEGGSETSLARLGPGDCFGEISLLDGAPRTATCRAVTAVSTLTLSRGAFFDFLKAHPDAAIQLLETLGRRQRETLIQLRTVRNANEVIQETVEGGPLWPRIADRIAEISASKQFLVFHVIWFVVWIAFNTLGGSAIFDEYPFGFLTVTVSLEAIFLSIFVLVSANRQGERDRIRVDIDHQVNLKAHQELLALHRKLDKLTEEIKRR